MEKQTMGAFISALRKSKGLTQKELAELLYVSDKAVSRWECDQTTPDINLLPIIADIFEITTDELIRGGRIKSEQPTDSQEKNIQKRLETILDAKFNSYKTKSIISPVLVVIGLIVSFICKEFAYYELGICLALIFFVCAIACQIIFLLNFKNSINTSDLNSGIFSQYKQKCFDFSFWIFTVMLCIMGLIFSNNYNLFWWCGPAASIGIFFICIFVKSIVVKNSGFQVSSMKKPNAKLFIKIFVSFVCIVSILVISMVTINVNCHEWIEKPEIFYVSDSTVEIENYIENQLLNGYGQCDYPLDEEEIDNEIKVTITDNDILFSDVIEYSCFINGYAINNVEKDGKSCKEVKLWTTSTRIKSGTMLDNINTIYIILYFICTVVAIVVYVLKSKKHNI